jgi:archaellum component FlaC
VLQPVRVYFSVVSFPFSPLSIAVLSLDTSNDPSAPVDNHTESDLPLLDTVEASSTVASFSLPELPHPYDGPYLEQRSLPSNDQELQAGSHAASPLEEFDDWQSPWDQDPDSFVALKSKPPESSSNVNHPPQETDLPHAPELVPPPKISIAAHSPAPSTSSSTLLLLLQSQLTGALTEISSLKSTLGVLEQEHRDYQARANQVLSSSSLPSMHQLEAQASDSAALTALQAQINTLRVERTANRNQINNLEGELSKLRETVLFFQEETADVKTQLELKTQQIGQFLSEQSRLIQHHAALQAELQTATHRELSVRDSNSLMQRQLQEKEALVASLQAEVHNLRSIPRMSTHPVSTDVDQTDWKRLSDQVVVQQVEIDRLRRLNSQFNQAPHTAVTLPGKSKKPDLLPPWVSSVLPKSTISRLLMVIYASLLQITVFFLLNRDIPNKESTE